MDELTTLVSQYEKPALLIISILLILILYIIVSRMLTRFIKRNQNVFLDDISTAIKLFSRFFTGYLIIVAIGLYYNLGSNVVLLLTGLVATIVSLSSIQIVNNFLAGIVIIILQPLEVNDYIYINGFEGRVTKITLNYTKIVTINDAFVLLPNRIILRADLINYTINKKVKKDDNSYFDEAQDILSPFIGNKITRYNFSLSLDITTLTKIIPELEKVCKEYQDIFGYEPTFFLYDLGWKLTYQFQVKSDDSEVIRTNLKAFRNKLLKTAYP